MKTVLMVAFHYPPCFGSSGMLRALKFSRYLPGRGWQPVVLTAHARAYEETRREQLAEIPSTVAVHRAFALDSRRHLAMRGRSLRVMALPDRWSSWVVGAVPLGLRLIRRYRPDAIWTTYPIASAHLIGWMLSRRTGVPWVADFRDSMTEDGYPRDGLTRRTYLAIERRVIGRAAALVFTAPSTRTMYLQRYPRFAAARCDVIPNGYDEEDFRSLEAAASPASGRKRPLRLLHAGAIYPEERDPRPFFRALSRLKESGRVSAETLSVELRASGGEQEYKRYLDELRIADIVRLLPALPYSEVLRDCVGADGLLVLQGPSCNHQIPAKVYEYLRAGKPILALSDRRGDTATLLSDTGGATVVDLLDETEISRGLIEFLEAVRAGVHPIADDRVTARYSREAQAGMLAECLDRVCESEVDAAAFVRRSSRGAGTK